MQNGQILLNDSVQLPEGAIVIVAILSPNGELSKGEPNAELSSMLLRHSGKGINLPADLASQHDHYAHGTPKH